MATGGGFRGVPASADSRFSNKEKKMMSKIKFPKELDVKIDPKKVNWKVMKEWVAVRVTQLLGGLEEEVLIALIINYLEAEQLDGKQLHMTLTPFLEKNTSLFMKELWSLLASANKTASHIPQPLLEAEAAKQAAVLQQQQAIQAQVEKARLDAQAKMQQQAQAPALPGPPAGPSGRQGGSGEGGGRSSRWDEDRDRHRYDDRRRDHRGSDRDSRPEGGRGSLEDRDGRDWGDASRRDGNRGRDRHRSRSASASRSRSPSPRRRRSRSPVTMRDRMRKQARHSRSRSPDAPQADRARPSDDAPEFPRQKKDKHKKDKKSKKKSRRHSRSDDSGDEGGGEGRKGGKREREESVSDDEDLQLLMQRALESAQQHRAASGALPEQ